MDLIDLKTTLYIVMIWGVEVEALQGLLREDGKTPLRFRRELNGLWGCSFIYGFAWGRGEGGGGDTEGTGVDVSGGG